jgi:hypothetical protein
MGHLPTLRQHGLRFDESLQFTGGSDFAFYLAAKRKGLKPSWCSDAIVSERIDDDRLTFAYQFSRSRQQGRAQGAILSADLKSALPLVPKAIVGAALLVFPAIGIASPAAGLQLLGSTLGRFDYLRGKRSRLYERG